MDYIKEEVCSLVKQYHTRDPFELCSSLNVQLYKIDLHPEINGVYQYAKRNRFIYINCNLPYRFQVITCAHELGHVILHKKMNCTFIKNHTLLSNNKIERSANLFAAHLIIPDEMLSFDGQTIYELAVSLEAPLELVKLKLEGSYF